MKIKNCSRTFNFLKYKLLYLSLMVIVPIQLIAQIQQDIFPDKKGQELLSLLVGQYKTNTVLSYDEARDALWGAVAKHNHDSLRCVYTGFAVYISPASAHPRTDAYNKGINCEHTWPQSLGAEGNAKSDMHHIFPTREDVNNARGNLPFADIPDDKTVYWYRLGNKLSVIPTVKIDEYSEIDNGNWFEPREDHKGNVARAMIYFYTMYKSQSDGVFFSKQLQTFYQWHYQDPVDDEERWRNNFIASKQEGKYNPFILDSTLIRRAYFPQYKGYQASVNDENSSVVSFLKGRNLIIRSKEALFEKAEIFDINGHLIDSKPVLQEDNNLEINLSGIRPQVLIVRLSGNERLYYNKILLTQ